MHNARFALPLLACLACSAFSALAADAPKQSAASTAPAAPVAVVNGEAIPAIFAELLAQTRQSRNMPAEAMTPAALRDGLVVSALLAQEAVKSGLDKTPEVSAILAFQKQESLRRFALEEYARTHPLSEEAMKAEYEKHKAQASDKEYSARHILVKDEKLALDLLAQLKKGKVKFEDLARKHSTDTLSKVKGGELGWMQATSLVPEFAKAMMALAKGQTTAAPVKTQFGWHIIRLDDMRKLTFPAYEDVKSQIANQMQQIALRRYVDGLKATAKVE